MMETTVYRIGDICKIKSGKRLPAGHELSAIPTLYRYIRSRDIKNGKINLEDVAYIDSETRQKIKKYIINTGDIAITIVANIGDVGYASSECDDINLTENAVRLTMFNESVVWSKYLAYYLNQTSIKTYMENLAVGAAQAKLGIYKIERIKVQLPEISIQKSIAKIIEQYDDLIDKNMKRIAILEQMAENLFKEWFVRYRFPGHESTTFVKNIPIDWVTCKFSQIANILSGGTPSTENDEYYGGMIPFYTPKDSVDNYYAFETITSITEEGLNHCNSQLYPKDTIMITARGTVGNMNLLAVPMAMNQSCYAINSNVIKSQFFLFFLLKREVQKLKKVASGGVFDTIVVNTFDHIKVIVPSDDIIDRFDRLILPIMNEAHILQKQNMNLIKQRDLFLPRLMNGKLAI